MRMKMLPFVLFMVTFVGVLISYSCGAAVTGMKLTKAPPPCPQGMFYQLLEKSCKNCSDCTIQDLINKICEVCGSSSSQGGYIMFDGMSNNYTRVFDEDFEVDDEDDYETDDILITGVVYDSNVHIWMPSLFLGLTALMSLVLISCFILWFRQRRNGKSVDLLSRRARIFSRDRLSTNDFINKLSNIDEILTVNSLDVHIAPDGTKFIEEVFTCKCPSGKRVASTIRLPVAVDDDVITATEFPLSGSNPVWDAVTHNTNKSLRNIDLDNLPSMPSSSSQRDYKLYVAFSTEDNDVENV